MSFFDISSGCNSCSSFTPTGDMSMNGLTQLDNNTNYLANMVSSGVMNNSNNSVGGGSLSQYPNQGTQQLSTQNMMNHFSNSSNNSSNNTSNNSNNGSNNSNNGNSSNNLSNNMPKQLNNKPKSNIALKKKMVNQKYKYENESDDDDESNNAGAMSSGSNFYLLLGLVFLIALSWHETIKFYINQSIKLNDGSPTYYIGYSVVATLLGFALYNYLTK